MSLSAQQRRALERWAESRLQARAGGSSLHAEAMHLSGGGHKGGPSSPGEGEALGPISGKPGSEGQQPAVVHVHASIPATASARE